jgi:hypothetical protein
VMRAATCRGAGTNGEYSDNLRNLTPEKPTIAEVNFNPTARSEKAGDLMARSLGGMDDSG